jgi:hypothetical protein
MLNRLTEKEARRHNSTYKKLAVQCSAHIFMVNQTLVLRIKICGKKSPPSPSRGTLTLIKYD